MTQTQEDNNFSSPSQARLTKPQVSQFCPLSRPRQWLLIFVFPFLVSLTVTTLIWLIYGLVDMQSPFVFSHWWHCTPSCLLGLLPMHVFYLVKVSVDYVVESPAYFGEYKAAEAEVFRMEAEAEGRQ